MTEDTAGDAPGEPTTADGATDSEGYAESSPGTHPGEATSGIPVTPTTQAAGTAEPLTVPGAPSVYGCPYEEQRGTVVFHCNRDRYLPLMTALKTDGFELPVGVTGVDYLTHPGRALPEVINAERFEVVVELLSLSHRRRARVRCQVPAGDPAVPTLFDLWPGAEAHERETYDMFGIRFDGHPDPSRILMPEDWEGHPLRKDYDTGHIPVQYKEAP
jgi:NADH-quinone oxidoreductase subunit C